MQESVKNIHDLNPSIINDTRFKKNLVVKLYFGFDWHYKNTSKENFLIVKVEDFFSNLQLRVWCQEKGKFLPTSRVENLRYGYITPK